MSKIIVHNGRLYHKSTFSSKAYKCVGVSIGKTDVLVINTKVKDITISFTTDEWKVFIEGVKNNEFDIKA